MKNQKAKAKQDPAPKKLKIIRNPLARNVDHVERGDNRDVTTILLEILEERGLRRFPEVQRFKDAVNHAARAQATPAETWARPLLPRIPNKDDEPEAGPYWERFLTMNIGPISDYNKWVRNAAQCFFIKAETLNAILRELDNRLRDPNHKRPPPTLEDFSVPVRRDTGDDAESVISDTPLLSRYNSPAQPVKRGAGKQKKGKGGGARPPPIPEHGEPTNGRRPFDGMEWDEHTPFAGDAVDRTKDHRARLLSLVKQVFCHIPEDHEEQQYLEWMVELMLDPEYFKTLPSSYHRAKVMEYFKLVLPSLHASDFLPSRVSFYQLLSAREEVLPKTEWRKEKERLERKRKEEEEKDRMKEERRKAAAAARKEQGSVSTDEEGEEKEETAKKEAGSVSTDEEGEKKEEEEEEEEVMTETETETEPQTETQTETPTAVPVVEEEDDDDPLLTIYRERREEIEEQWRAVEEERQQRLAREAVTRLRWREWLQEERRRREEQVEQAQLEASEKEAEEEKLQQLQQVQQKSQPRQRPTARKLAALPQDRAGTSRSLSRKENQLKKENEKKKEITTIPKNGREGTGVYLPQQPAWKKERRRGSLSDEEEEEQRADRAARERLQAQMQQVQPMRGFKVKEELGGYQSHPEDIDMEEDVFGMPILEEYPIEREEREEPIEIEVVDESFTFVVEDATEEAVLSVSQPPGEGEFIVEDEKENVFLAVPQSPCKIVKTEGEVLDSPASPLLEKDRGSRSPEYGEEEEEEGEEEGEERRKEEREEEGEEGGEEEVLAEMEDIESEEEKEEEENEKRVMRRSPRVEKIAREVAVMVVDGGEEEEEEEDREEEREEERRDVRRSPRGRQAMRGVVKEEEETAAEEIEDEEEESEVRLCRSSPRFRKQPVAVKEEVVEVQQEAAAAAPAASAAGSSGRRRALQLMTGSDREVKREEGEPAVKRAAVGAAAAAARSNRSPRVARGHAQQTSSPAAAAASRRKGSREEAEVATTPLKLSAAHKAALAAGAAETMRRCSPRGAKKEEQVAPVAAAAAAKPEAAGPSKPVGNAQKSKIPAPGQLRQQLQQPKERNAAAPAAPAARPGRQPLQSLNHDDKRTTRQRNNQ